MKLIFSPLNFILMLLLSLLLSDQILEKSFASKVGINYGQKANNLPSPNQVLHLLESINISRVKLYDADPNVLTAFLNSNVEFIISISNDNIQNMTDPNQAQAWIKENVQPFLPQSRITCITVGNEILSGEDTAMMSNLLPAMQSMHQALQALNLSGQVNISTAHALSILSNSFPPSLGSFQPNLLQYIQPLLNFLSQTKSPFLINVYPYFAYKADPATVSLDYVLFEPNPGVNDPNTNLTYDNMLYAQVDSVYAAMKAVGRTDVLVSVSETGWPSKGDSDEPGATVQNAGIYNGNLLRRIGMNQGTPLNPDVPVDVYVFALFNEDMKTGPTSERNYGLFYPDGSPVYHVGLQDMPSVSSALEMKVTGLNLFLLAVMVVI